MIKATVTLIAYSMPIESDNPEKIVAAAAKLCYSKSNIAEIMDNLNDDEISKFVTLLATIKHESPLEHISFTFGIENVSRITEQQLTRHRLASYSIQSGRYVKRDPKIYKPVSVDICNDASLIFDDMVEKTKEAYLQISDILMTKYIKDGMKEELAEKKAIEDARCILPGALETKIIVTMNARSLINFFQHRCCSRSQEEMRFVANQMLDIVLHYAPNVFSKAGPSCVFGKCQEGRMSCGNRCQPHPLQDR